MRRRKNLAQAKSFKDLLEQTLRKYHNRLIDAAAVIKILVQMRREWEKDDERAKELGLDPEELAFYDAVAANFAGIYEQPFLRELIHQVVQTVCGKYLAKIAECFTSWQLAAAFAARNWLP